MTWVVRQEPHRCFVPDPVKCLDSCDSVDDVFECDVCGQRWVLRKWAVGYGFVPLRWYHLQANRLARRQAARTEDPPGPERKDRP